METNNVILFVFGLIFILLGFFSPIINGEFGNEYVSVDSSGVTDIEGQDLSSTTAIQVLSGLFIWVFNAPVWLNLLLTMMRVLFWVIVYDKIRGI